MKKIAFFYFLLILPKLSWSSEEIKGLFLSYSITSSKPDETVAKGESKFEFTCARSDGNGKIQLQDIRFSYNGKNKTLKTNSEGKFNINTQPGKYVFQFYYNKEYFEIYTDSVAAPEGYKTEIHLFFESSLHPVIADKPVIYVYPEKSTEVNIQLDFKGEMNFTYPAYNSGWNFTAENDGTIKMNGKEYNYLFWEGTSMQLQNEAKSEEGFIVEKNNLLPFLENSLATIGLTSKEQADFITYWYPRMMNNEKNYIRFIFNDDYNAYATLKVSPQPESMIRVFMVWYDYTGEKNTSMKQQSLPSFNRKGFTLVEWGGSEIIIPEN